MQKLDYVGLSSYTFGVMQKHLRLTHSYVLAQSFWGEQMPIKAKITTLQSLFIHILIH